MTDSLQRNSVNTNQPATRSPRSRKLGIGHLTAVGVAALALALSACSSETESSTETLAGPSVAELMESGTITIGTKFDQPGFGFMNPETNEPEGFDVEIGKIIAASLGISPENITWVESVSAQKAPLIVEGAVDLVVATYTINDQRKEVISFAGPYFVAGQDLMVTKGNPLAIFGPEDLAGKTVCSGDGSTSPQNIQKNYPEVKITLFDVYSKCAEALKNGEVDAVTTDNAILLGFVAQDPEAFEVVGKPFTKEPYGIGLKLGNTDLRNFINDALEASYADGSWVAAWEATAGKFLDTPVPPAVDRY
jgi:glutamate transport system substrate-binding protein